MGARSAHKKSRRPQALKPRTFQRLRLDADGVPYIEVTFLAADGSTDGYGPKSAREHVAIQQIDLGLERVVQSW